MVKVIKTVLERFFRPQATDSFDIFESKIDGEFHGWSGNTRFALTNGQVWQQASGAQAQYNALSPKVLIYRSGPAIKMQVEGVTHSIFVKRIK